MKLTPPLTASVFSNNFQRVIPVSIECEWTILTVFVFTAGLHLDITYSSVCVTKYLN